MPSLFAKDSQGAYVRTRIGYSVAAAIMLGSLAPNGLPLDGTTTPAVGQSAPASGVEALGRLPLRFEQNVGQVDGPARYVLRSAGGSLFLTDTEAVFSLPPAKVPGPVTAAHDIVRMQPLHARTDVQPTPGRRLDGVTNYLVGADPSDWKKGVPSYDSVRYPGIYSGIDLVFHGGQRKLEYDYVVAAGADPGTIAIGFDTHGSVRVDPSGDLVISGRHSSLRQPKPVAYQEVGGRRLEVPVKFVLLARNEVGFEVGEYDRRWPLVIDPIVEFVSFLGGTGEGNGERATGLVVDAAGNIYVSGTTESVDFPVKGPQITEPNGSEDAFVTKLTPDGSSLIYSTVFGGSSSELTGTERGGGIAIDESGAPAVVGSTLSVDFPTTSNAYDRTCGTEVDAFGFPESGCNANETYVGGVTTAGSTTFKGTRSFFNEANIGQTIYSAALPAGTTIESVQSYDTITLSAPATVSSDNVRHTVTERRRWRDAFVSRLAPDGASLTYSTYLGGHRDEYFEVGVTVDDQGIYLAGATFSDDFPTTDNALDRTCGTVIAPEIVGTCNTPTSFSDGVTGADPENPNDLLSSDARFNGEDSGKLVVGDNIAPNTVILYVPQTNRARLSQPPTAAGTGLSFTILDRKPMTLDGFVVRINPNVSGADSLRYSSFLGGSADDRVNGIAAVPGSGGNVVLGGTTFSGDFPISTTAFDRACGAEPTPGAPCDTRDGFVARFDTNSSEESSLRWASYLGGAGDDDGFTVATDATQSVFVTGRTEASGFPTKSAYQDTYQGNGDAFVTKMTADGTGLVFSTFLGGTGNDSGAAITVDKNGSAHIAGFGDTGFPQAGGIVQPSNVGLFAAKLSSSGTALVYSAILSPPSCCGGIGGVAADGAGNTIVTGSSGGDEDFPSVTGGLGLAARSGRDVWLLKLVAGQMPVVTGLVPPGGPIPGGTSVVIKGEHLLGATKVTFGGVSASFTVNSSTQITAVSPARPAGVALGDSVFVNVTTPTATSLNVSPSRYVYGIGLPTGACADPCPLSGAMVALKTGKMLLTLGQNSTLYDPATGTWKATGSCTGCDGVDYVVPNHGVILLADGRALFTGFGGGSTSSYLYDPSTEVWSPTQNGSGTVTDMVVPRRGHTTTLLPNGKVLAAGGYDINGEVIASAEIFDPSSGTWTATGAMTQPRQWHTATVLDPTVGNCGSNCGKVLVAFGLFANTFQANNTAELYDPTTGTWGQASAALGAGSLAGAAVQLKDGKVLLLGGSDSIGYGWHGRNSTDLFDPAGGTDGSWSVGSTMKSVRAQHPGTVLLADGSVLVTGSADYYNFDAPPPVAELRNPTDGKWTQVAVLPSDNYAQAGLIPPGPLSACSTRCGTVLAVDSRSAQIWAPPPAVTALSPTSGPTGTQVTISGTGLAAITAVRFGSVSASFTSDSLLPDRKIVAVTPTLPAGTVDVTVSGPGGASATSAATKFTVTVSSGQQTTTTTVTAPPSGGSGGQTAVQSQHAAATTGAAALGGYRLVAADGGVFAFGLPFLGSTGGTRLNQPMAATASTPSGRGYWMAGRDGGVFAFGDAGYFGSTGGIRLASPIAGMARTPTGRGYWLVAADGGVFAFGDAKFFGSTGGVRLARPIVAIASTPTGNGYWLVGADGGVFAFGDATFFGSTGALRLAQPVVGVSTSPSGNGYRLVASDGGVFAFGDARFLGSTGAMRLAQPVVAVTPTSSGNGYWLVASDGGVFAFGDATFLGSTGALRLAQPVVASAGG